MFRCALFKGFRAREFHPEHRLISNPHPYFFPIHSRPTITITVLKIRNENLNLQGLNLFFSLLCGFLSLFFDFETQLSQIALFPPLSLLSASQRRLCCHNWSSKPSTATASLPYSCNTFFLPVHRIAQGMLSICPTQIQTRKHGQIHAPPTLTQNRSYLLVLLLASYALMARDDEHS